MSLQGCEFCIDAPELEFDYCRVCGRGQTEPTPEPEHPMVGMRIAVRIANGGPFPDDSPADKQAYEAARREGRHW